MDLLVVVERVSTVALTVEYYVEKHNCNVSGGF